MKKLIFLPVLFALAIEAQAQSPKTLISNDFSQTSGFGGFMIQLQSVDGQMKALTGGGGAVIFDNRFYFGGYGLGLSDDLDVTFEGIEYDVDYGHGGFLLGYVIRPADLIHFGISSKIGWGEISFQEKFLNVDPIRYRDQVFVVSPQVEAEVNMTNWFKFNVGAGYQTTVGVDNFYYGSSDFNGLTVGISFIFGWFD